MKKVMAVILSIGLLAGMVFSSPVSGAATPVTFSDISGHWGKSGIEQAITRGYVNGYSDETFRPNKQVTRAEFIKMVVDALKLPHPQGGTPWYQPYVAAALEFDVLRDVDSKLDWNLPLTRMEMVRFAIRATDTDSKESLSDSEFLYKAAKSGILHGMTNGDLAPEGTSTRAQAVAVIERILVLRSGGSLPVDIRASSYAEVQLTGSNIQTMWGVTAKTLPMKVDLGSKLDISIDKLLIVDMTDANRPYMDMFPEIMTAMGDIADDHYLIAMHFNIKNNNMKDHVIWDLVFKISGSGMNGIFTTSYISPEQRGNSSITYVPTFFLDKTKEVDGWYLISVPRDTINSNEVNKVVYFYDIPHQKRVYLTPEG